MAGSHILNRILPPLVHVYILLLHLSPQSLIRNTFPEHAISILVPFNVICILVQIYFVLSCTTSPGYPPKTTKNTVNNIKICRKCNLWKPDRAHHCSDCNRCILTMDHHCLWTGTCIGHQNQPHFIRFLFYVVLGTSFALLVELRMLVLWSTDPYYAVKYSVKWHSWVILAGNIIGNGVTWLFCGILFVFQVLGVIGGYSAVEAAQLETITRQIHHGTFASSLPSGPHDSSLISDKFVFPYDLGWKRNVTSMFGSLNPLYILFGWKGRPGTGLSFEKIDESIPWPPPGYQRQYPKTSMSRKERIAWRKNQQTMFFDPLDDTQNQQHNQRFSQKGDSNERENMGNTSSEEEGFPQQRQGWWRDDDGEMVVPTPRFVIPPEFQETSEIQSEDQSDWMLVTHTDDDIVPRRTQIATNAPGSTRPRSAT